MNPLRLMKSPRLKRLLQLNLKKRLLISSLSHLPKRLKAPRCRSPLRRLRSWPPSPHLFGLISSILIGTRKNVRNPIHLRQRLPLRQ